MTRVSSSIALEPSNWPDATTGLREGLARCFDCALAIVLLVLSAPVMVLVAFAIRLEDGGPVLYRQTRVGYRARSFEILKLRSMRVDAEVDGTARWASDHDPRVTRVGRFIRRTRIDEIPQLVNVLRGDMRLVGPRPERPCFAQMLAGELLLYPRRHLLRPGITGWAQIRYRYASSVAEAARKLEYDLYYLEHQSVALDLRILLETVWIVVTMRGAR
jgi:lipopolysaccharide/colanic/teichoic acid biosynthesis glycosyltransferase